MPKLLREYFSLDDVDPKEVKRSFENEGKIILRGVMQRADTLNQNGRVYPMAILQREVRNYQKFIIENRATGELDHPPESTISLKNVSHIVRELYMDGKDARGSIEVLHKVPSGLILKGLVESGVKIGISSRGVGDVEEKGNYTVVLDSFQLICFDTVSDPSTTSAFMIPECRNVNTTELQQLRTHFTKEDRIDRILNDILHK
jgi:hypothetical protein